MRQRETDPRVTPTDLSFTFDGPDKVSIKRPAGFDAGAIYELIYQAKDPKVMGMGFAATRDIVSFLRRETADAAGTPIRSPAASTTPSRSACLQSGASCTTSCISASTKTKPAAWCSTG